MSSPEFSIAEEPGNGSKEFDELDRDLPKFSLSVSVEEPVETVKVKGEELYMCSLKCLYIISNNVHYGVILGNMPKQIIF